jgi:hypothetical protein
MVTLSPTLGIPPLPSLRTVFVTPMIAGVREKLRNVESLAIDEGSVVRSFGKAESMGNFFFREGGIDELYLWFGGRSKVR